MRQSAQNCAIAPLLTQPFGLRLADVDSHGCGSDFPHIDVSNVVLCYLTQKWFTNTPCVREVVRAMVRGKKLIALLEHDQSDQHGGCTEAECIAVLKSHEYAQRLLGMEQQVAEWVCEMGENVRVPTGEEIVEALFSSLVVVWYRLTDFQEGTLRLIAEELLTPGSGSRPDGCLNPSLSLIHI